jgi:hypothetical protein
MVDVARRLCEDNQIVVNEVWSFHAVGDEVRFTLVHKAREAAEPPARPRTSARPAAPAVRRKGAAAAKRAATSSSRGARKAKPGSRKVAKKARTAQKRK